MLIREVQLNELAIDLSTIQYAVVHSECETIDILIEFETSFDWFFGPLQW